MFVTENARFSLTKCKNWFIIKVISLICGIFSVERDNKNAEKL